DGDPGMPVVRCPDNDRVDLLVCKQLTIVVVLFRVRPEYGGSLVAVLPVYVAGGDYLYAHLAADGASVSQPLPVSALAAARTDHTHDDPVARSDPLWHLEIPL